MTRPDADAVNGHASQIPDRLIASALDFAVGIAAAGVKMRPALPIPSELRPFLKFQKLTGKALTEVRRAVEGDPVFRERLGSVATRDLLDEAGMLWLTRPDGWEETLAAMAAPADVETPADIRRAEKRREAAEQAAARALAEIAALRAELTRLAEVAATANADAAAARREREAATSELRRVLNELRRAEAREADAAARAEAAVSAAGAADARAAAAEATRDAVLAERVDAGGDRVALARAAELAASVRERASTADALATELRGLAAALGRLEPAPVAAAPARTTRKRAGAGRRPVALPGGVYGSSFAAAEFLARHQGVVVLVDGYNVAKLAWPRLTLEHQRERCIDAAEDVARRFGTNVTVVFDGAGVTGASAPSRRLVRVRFSPEGTSADDVLRAEVDALPATTPIVVVTNDQAVAVDVRARGANTMTSEQWLELAGR